MLEAEKSSEPHNTSQDILPGYKLAYCERCDWRFLVPVENPLPACPHCFRAPLQVVQVNEKTGHEFDVPAPELCLPFSLPDADVNRNLQEFSRSIWFTPTDLTLANLAARMQKMYLPTWLVDVEVSGTWQAEVGFNYQVLSHQERYDQGRGWLTEEQQETRVRWETRLGKLQRFYQNNMAAAMEDQVQLDRQLGVYDRQGEKAYSPGVGGDCSICLPDRPAEDAWGDAQPRLQALAADECRQAAGGDHIRNYRWSVDFTEKHWTLLLKPVHTTYYLDDENQPQLVLVNGQTGKLSAVLKASMRRAQRASQRILLVAIVFFLISLLVSLGALLEPFLLGIGIFGLTIAAAIGLMAIIPIAMAWQVNRKTG